VQPAQLRAQLALPLVRALQRVPLWVLLQPQHW